MDTAMENTKENTGEDVKDYDASIPSKFLVQQTPSGTNESNSGINTTDTNTENSEATLSTDLAVQDASDNTNGGSKDIGTAYTDKENTEATNSNNDDKQHYISYEGFPYVVDHEGKTYVRWRCQRHGQGSTQCQALLNIGKYPNEGIDRRLDHNCISMTKNWITVTVINKSHPESWSVVTNDLTSIVIYTNESGRKLVYYNKSNYAITIDSHSEDCLLFKCTTLSTCTAVLKLRNEDNSGDTSKIMLLEDGVHSCKLLQEEMRYLRIERMIEIRKRQRDFVYVKVIDYVDNYDQDLKTLLRLQEVPDLDPNDTTTIVRYRNEYNKNMVYYKGYEYIFKKKKHVCYKSSQCKARLIVALTTSKVLEFGKHTCNGNNTASIKSEVVEWTSKDDNKICSNDMSKQRESIENLDSSDGLGSKGVDDEIEMVYETKIDLHSCNEIEGNTIKDEDIVNITNAEIQEPTSQSYRPFIFDNNSLTKGKNQLSLDPTGCVEEIENKNDVNFCIEGKQNTTKGEDRIFIVDSLPYTPVKFRDYSQTKGNNVSGVPRLKTTNSSIVTVYMEKGNRAQLQKVMYYKGYTYLDDGKRTLLYLCKSLKCSAALKVIGSKKGVCVVGTHNCKKADSVDGISRRNDVPKTCPESTSETQTANTVETYELNKFNPDNGSELETETAKSSRYTSVGRKNVRPDQSVSNLYKYDGNKYVCYQKQISVDKEESYPLLTHSCLASDPISKYPSLSDNGQTGNVPSIIDLVDVENTLKVNNAEIIEDEIKLEIEEIKVEMDDAIINEANSLEQDYLTFKTEPGGPDNACNDVQGSNNSSFDNYVPILPNMLGQPYLEVIPDARSAGNIFPTSAENVQVSSNTDFAYVTAANALDQPYVVSTTLAVCDPIGQPCREVETLGTPSQVNLGEHGTEKGKKSAPLVEYRDVKLKNFLEETICDNSLEEFEQTLKMDSDGAKDYDVAVFRDKKNRNLFYYQGHTYLADKKSLSMCSNQACSAALKVRYGPTTVEVAELGVHDCYLTDLEIQSAVQRISVESDAPVTAPSTNINKLNLGRKRAQARTKSKEDLNLKRRTIKANKSLYDTLIEKVKKNKNIKIINDLVTKFVKIPVDEQTRFSVVTNKNEMFIKFRGFTHQKIRIEANTNKNIMSYICIKFNELCDGSLLMAGDKVIEFRDHFCQGQEHSYIPNDRNTLRIYYNTANACPELSYNGFKFWNTYWNKWKVADGSYWICSQANCYVNLKITDNMVSQLRQHQCGASKKNTVERKGTAENVLIPVKDEEGMSCMIYNGFVYRLMENKEPVQSSWVCIKKQSSDCTGSLHINKSKVSSISKHCCWQQGTSSNGGEPQKNKTNSERHLLNLSDIELGENRSWHCVSETNADERILFYAPAISKNKKAAKYIFYRGYIYRSVALSNMGFQRGDCIYGGSNSSCRGVLTCKKFMPIAVSNHSCREERMGNKNSDVTIIEDDIQPFVKAGNPINESIDIKEEGVQGTLVNENFEIPEDDITGGNEKNIDLALQLLDRIETSAGVKKRKHIQEEIGTMKLPTKIVRLQKISGVKNIAEEINFAENMNRVASNFRSDDDIEATLPCTIIQTPNKLGENVNNVVIEISDDEA